MASIVEALKDTPKGRLALDPLSPKEQLELLNNISSPPGIHNSFTQKYNRPRPKSPPLLPSPEPTPPASLDETNNLILTSTTLPQSPPSWSKRIDTDVLSDDETKEITECIKKRRSHFLEEKKRILSEHSLRTSEREERLQMMREDDSFQRTMDEHSLMQEAEKEEERIRISYQEYSEITEKRIHDNQEKMKQTILKIQQRKELLSKLEKDVLILKEKGKRLLDGCRYHQLMDNNAPLQFDQRATSILQNIEEQRAAESPDPLMLNNIKSLVTGLLPLLPLIKEEVERANKAGADLIEKQKKQKEEEGREAERKRLEDLKKTQGTATTPSAKTQNEKGSAPVAAATGDNGLMIIPKSALQRYEELIEKLEKANTQTATFSKTSDPQMKKYKFSLQKAVNMVGAVSGQTGSQLLHIVQQIKRLLSGDIIEVSGKRVTVKDHPLARDYCINLLARKIVEQAGEASRFVFTLAGIVVLLWHNFPEFGDLFLAHCYHTCPVLVPLYFRKNKGMSEIEFKKLLGYKVVGGILEEDKLFNDRLSGCVKLYAAVIQTTPIMGVPNHHGLDNGWTLIARLLNSEPQHNITAIALKSLLEVAGHGLMKKYGRQFKKIVLFLWQEYIKKIESVTASGERQPFVELQLFLEKCMKEGRIPVPDGVLTDDFWRRREVSIIGE
ncbi:PREDICTED: nucleoporin GLE1-like isoform X1 [Amphimedon queenslandica]|uniref:mRNA export factor GLE1 n=1 Tax=Amphimedon queenslandica TaxID=400682 RepID=A0A1X7TYK8_AMPQE|nr:PREDICTED: nucleoporin GLE1-like isoform X1 [Amphimedon queenslandica]|eukprot:XP_019857032.1 PREDICTED: nucleoporin GLE1-like isoform X1 [Amphimedon queenslandica]